MHAPVRKKGTGGSLHLGLSCILLGIGADGPGQWQRR